MSMKEKHDCAWCGCDLQEETTLCPECHAAYEAESQRPLHAHEERHPHND